MTNILVADDSLLIRKMLKTILTDAGCEVICTENGADALEVLADTPVDIAIIDLFMPEKEGLETIREIRSRYERVKIIAISGDKCMSSDDSLGIAEKFGALHTFSKPLDIKRLLEAVKNISEKKSLVNPMF